MYEGRINWPSGTEKPKVKRSMLIYILSISYKFPAGIETRPTRNRYLSYY